MSLDAMKQALEALELYQSKSSVQMFDVAITALRAAIEQAEQPRQWQGLTADEMEGLYQMATYMDETDYIHMLMTAEAKLKEKNT